MFPQEGEYGILDLVYQELDLVFQKLDLVGVVLEVGMVSKTISSHLCAQLVGNPLSIFLATSLVFTLSRGCLITVCVSLGGHIPFFVDHTPKCHMYTQH